ncbi:glycine-rich cell wall structural protein 1-like [Papaver somniferum]|uniref:glycine-rich cell wall structural protein 1-like n=1 Tax=Papaver somniferum TaxID=3469 RepID=UPI000E6FC0EC|nr:glycine-rich cell wall structural protein 1-like [Papaver somniferum]
MSGRGGSVTGVRGRGGETGGRGRGGGNVGGRGRGVTGGRGGGVTGGLGGGETGDRVGETGDRGGGGGICVWGRGRGTPTTTPISSTPSPPSISEVYHGAGGGVAGGHGGGGVWGRGTTPAAPVYSTPPPSIYEVGSSSGSPNVDLLAQEVQKTLNCTTSTSSFSC